VLRQGLRREHVGAVVAVCAAMDALLIAAGVYGLGGGQGYGARAPAPAFARPRAWRWLDAAVGFTMLVLSALLARRMLVRFLPEPPP
jgi:arginine exporter protein ArgO